MTAIRLGLRALALATRLGEMTGEALLSAVDGWRWR